MSVEVYLGIRNVWMKTKTSEKAAWSTKHTEKKDDDDGDDIIIIIIIIIIIFVVFAVFP